MYVRINASVNVCIYSNGYPTRPQGPVSWRPTTVKWRQFSQSYHHSTIGTRQTWVSWSVTTVCERWGEVWLHVCRWWLRFMILGFVKCRWWNDGSTVKTVVTWRSSASMIPALGVCCKSLVWLIREVNPWSAELEADALTTRPWPHLRQQWRTKATDYNRDQCLHQQSFLCLSKKSLSTARDDSSPDHLWRKSSRQSFNSCLTITGKSPSW